MTLRMREALAQDAAFIRRIFLLPHARAYVNAPKRDIILATLEEPDAESYVIENSGGPAGHFLLRNRGFLVEFSLLIAAEQGRGAGTFALEWGLRRAFKQLRAHRVCLEVREDNLGTRRLCERLGFRLEGLYRDGYRDERTGEFRNLCPYGILENEYQPPVLRNAPRFNRSSFGQ